jgi:hypothetical protein
MQGMVVKREHRNGLALALFLGRYRARFQPCNGLGDYSLESDSVMRASFP